MISRDDRNRSSPKQGGKAKRRCSLGGVWVAIIAVSVCWIQGTTAELASAQAPPGFCQGTKAGDVSASRSDAETGVVLAINKPNVPRGSVVYARLLNFTSKEANYGVAFAIERYSTSGWLVDASSPSGPWPKVRGRLSPGSAGRCYRFEVPSAQAVGRYRLSTRVEIRANGGKISRLRVAEFKVT